jgi:hypothetical protein
VYFEAQSNTEKSVSSTPLAVPFLFRFAKPCLSPGRYAKPSDDYYYDTSSSIVRWRNGTDNPPAVLKSGDSRPKTKKSDLEKGEDMKDRRMWR